MGCYKWHNTGISFFWRADLLIEFVFCFRCHAVIQAWGTETCHLVYANKTYSIQKDDNQWEKDLEECRKFLSENGYWLEHRASSHSSLNESINVPERVCMSSDQCQQRTICNLYLTLNFFFLDTVVDRVTSLKYFSNQILHLVDFIPNPITGFFNQIIWLVKRTHLFRKYEIA